MESNQTQQELPMQTEPQAEHHWLQKLVGEWIYETEVVMGPDQPLEKATGTESVRWLSEPGISPSLGGLWILAEGQGEMCGTVATTMMTLGYDPQKQRYVGTWISSMMAYLWLYDGELDEAKRVLTLNSKGPDMNVEGKMSNYKDVLEFKRDDLRVMTSYASGDDGQWYKFMTANYRRQ
ncbi:MAG: DUF1579 domain-containing protein [Cyanobacteria bacterium P01_A01_bin.123]